MPIEQTRQVPQPLTPRYRKLLDFVQPPEEHLRETQEISVIPRMKLPAINMTTGESIVPWVTAWSNQEKTSSITTYKIIEQTCYTPIPEIFSNNASLHLPTTKYPNNIKNADNQINAFISTQNAESHTEKSPRRKRRTGFIWKYIGLVIPRFRTRRRASLKSSRVPTQLQ
jgi:hypothetical protein